MEYSKTSKCYAEVLRKGMRKIPKKLAAFVNRRSDSKFVRISVQDGYAITVSRTSAKLRIFRKVEKVSSQTP